MRAGDRADPDFSRIDAAADSALRGEDCRPPREDHAPEPCAKRRERDGHVYAALDLGTNNCRLLIARPLPSKHGDAGFRVIDSFSRIVRLGEGLSVSGRLSADAIERTIDALDICRQKMLARGVTRARLIATEACRAAQNGADFLRRARLETGLDLEIVDRETEAHLAAAGSASLADAAAASVVLFDIGGGSSEIVWLGQACRGDASADKPAETPLRERVRFWVSLKLGVVTLAERFGGLNVSGATFDAMVEHVSGELQDFVAMVGAEQRCGRFHLLGTSGTVTTIAGVFLGLSRYDRRRVDGLWMSSEEVSGAIASLRNMTYDERAMNGCIGVGRADLVLAGCAILEAIRRSFPAERVRIADRGLREGILMQLIDEDLARDRAVERAAG
ncbi:Ppx/GppA phosphatase [Methylocella silvestris BL2]|uniref:Ppx/GppA phosphatase n=1 Tax=Methylocella silvestris (strain DSM 15510 / CIP 108128 / LMG 27833 / NCIMB 13906 / BL2) TaxID=395965 RepID=B8ERB2_METSB|nr:Ppx/GppA phosphatase family protein [Methylocella silvestris]ACK50296.1 Ppx/GppA phosphatase [Methylocella silvestris BL2]